MSNAVTLEDPGKIKIVRFNRPEIRSPLSAFVLRKLHNLLDDLQDDTFIEGLVFTGVGDVFASGADLREIAELTSETAPEFGLLGQKLMGKIAGLRVPTAAAINGFCFGGALDLSLSCKFRTASRNAQFSHPGANLGIMTGWGGTQRLPRLVGEARALEMFFTAKRVDAAEALEIGLVNELSDDPLGAAIALITNEH